MPRVSHAHKAGGKGGGAGKRPLPVVPGLGVEAMFAAAAGCGQGRVGGSLARRPSSSAAAPRRDGELGKAAPHATRHSQIGINPIRYLSFVEGLKEPALPSPVLVCWGLVSTFPCN